jgi:hypothetical protein
MRPTRCPSSPVLILALIALGGAASETQASGGGTFLNAFTVPSGASTRFQRFTTHPKHHGLQDALCNDGTQPVFYLKRAKNRNTQKWQIHLKGGRACNSMESCIKRFTTDPEKMSSARSTPTLRLGGIFHDSGSATPNPFREEYNQVFIPYCSSDSWAGTGFSDFPRTGPGSSQALEAARRADLSADFARLQAQNPALYSAAAEQAALSELGLEHSRFEKRFCRNGRCRIRFNGSRILDAVLKQLQNDPNLPVQMPASPEEILLTGSSAGSAGVRKNLDRVAALFPQTRTLGVSDAGYFHDPEEALAARALASPPTLTLLNPRCQPAFEPTVSATRASFNTMPLLAFFGSVHVDTSCEANQLAAFPTATPWEIAQRCSQAPTLMSEITTPLFVFQTYTDGVLIEPFDSNMRCDLATRNEIAIRSYNELKNLGRATFGYESELHTSLAGDSFFNQRHRVQSVAGARLLNFMNTLYAWTSGQGQNRVNALACPSGCPSCQTQACPLPAAP